MIDKNKLKEFLAERIDANQRLAEEYKKQRDLKDQFETLLSAYEYLNDHVDAGTFDLPTHIQPNCPHVEPKKIDYPFIPNELLCFTCYADRKAKKRVAENPLSAFQSYPE